MRKLLMFFLSVFLINTLFANPIDETLALKVAGNFYQASFPSTKKSGAILSLAYKCGQRQTSNKKSGSLSAYYYVYNTGNQGFIIVAGDDASSPILGYSTESNFVSDKIPQNVAKWLESYKEQIRFITEKNIPANETIKSEWETILSGLSLPKKRGAVAPLIQTKWNQSPYVNDKCPYDKTYKERVVTGCPATAMAQILKYWKYPKKGIGNHSYKHDKYGTLSANFSTTTYNWDNMPNEVDAANTDVATLMYHCGVAVEMGYNVAAEGGSGSYVIIDALNRYSKEQTVQNALTTYFGYAKTISGIERSSYADAQWIAILKAELDAGRPIQYAGYSVGGGHTFVCDGYDANNFFHMNWGWGGMYDAYFKLNSLNPGNDGIGSGSGTYNNNQQALIGIKPADAVVQTYELQTYADVVSDKTSISFGEGFTISSDVLNKGTATFAGEICAAAFDENGTFIDYIGTNKTVSNLGANQHLTSGISFVCTGLQSLLPGTYKISIFFRPTGGTWLSLSAATGSSLSDYTTITVTNTKDIHMYSSMVLTPNDNIYSGEAFSVLVDIANYGTSTFTGQVSLSLYSTEGDLISTIATKTGLSLNTNTHFTNGLTFSTNNLDVVPGSYNLMVSYKKDGGTEEFAGSTMEYLNPLEIIVQDVPEQADSYENNDEIEKAYAFTLSYPSGASKKTTGSTIHKGIDEDYYKFSLNEAKNYTISTRLQDAYNTNDGNDYTLDALFAYSLDGINWSDAYDDVLDIDIQSEGAQTIYFWVSPFFTGETGTYQLDVNITNAEDYTTSVVSKKSDLNISVFPNPASESIRIDLSNYASTIETISISDISGKVLYNSKITTTEKVITIPVSDLKEGVYLVKVTNSIAEVITKKIMVQK